LEKRRERERKKSRTFSPENRVKGERERGCVLPSATLRVTPMPWLVKTNSDDSNADAETGAEGFGRAAVVVNISRLLAVPPWKPH